MRRVVLALSLAVALTGPSIAQNTAPTAVAYQKAQAVLVYRLRLRMGLNQLALIRGLQTAPVYSKVRAELDALQASLPVLRTMDGQ